MSKAAKGIHADLSRKLGRRPAVKKAAIAFADHVTVELTAPIADVAPALVWPMDVNDLWGDCVVAAVDHALQAIYTTLAGGWHNWTHDEIAAFYRTQNPGFDPNTKAHGSGSADDAGMVIQDFLAELTREGVLLGFAKIDHTDAEQVKLATWLGLAIITGEDLRKAQQEQDDVWEYVPKSGEWGGHATTWVGYHDELDTAVTWGRLVEMAPSFVDNQVEEAWFILTQAHVDHAAFREGFDLESFGAAYEKITGRTFPKVHPTEPITPAEVDPDHALADVLRPWAAKPHRGINRIAAQAASRWLVDKGLQTPPAAR